MPLLRKLDDNVYGLDLARMVFDKQRVKFSKTEAARLVGGGARLRQLIMEGKIRMDKTSPKQNGKWFCNGGDVLKYLRL